LTTHIKVTFDLNDWS